MPVVLAALTLSGCAGGAAAVTTSTGPAGRTRVAPARRISSTRQTLLVAPSADPAAPFVAMIAGARRHVELTMYELQDPEVEDALVAAALRGVAVRVLLNRGYYSHRTSANDGALAFLRARHVPVRLSSSSFAYTHQKTLIVDGRRAAIMTLNFTRRYYATTRDFAVLDPNGADVAAIEAVFDADWRARAIAPSTGAGGLVWSPGATDAFVTMIGSARQSLDVESEELTDRSAIAALCAAARQGVAVRVVMTYDPAWLPAFAQLRGCGARIHVFHGEHPLYIHAKLILADRRRALISSQNLTPTSLERNRELGIVTTAPAVTTPAARTFDSDFRQAQPN
jgi:phosphatidylserine/phosphatidylglycerophosphate/cardiolipin synthase-like enzyme